MCGGGARQVVHSATARPHPGSRHHPDRAPCLRTDPAQNCMGSGVFVTVSIRPHPCQPSFAPA